MGDGIKAMYDDIEKDDNILRNHHIRSLGFEKISGAIKELSTILNRFDSDSLVLSRSKWGQLDEIKEIVRSLEP